MQHESNGNLEVWKGFRSHGHLMGRLSLWVEAEFLLQDCADEHPVDQKSMIDIHGDSQWYQ